MPSKLPLYGWIVALTCALLWACGAGGQDGVAAVVNGYKITYADLEAYYRNQMQDQDEPPSEEQARMLRLNLLREIIDRQLLLQRAEELGFTAVEAEVDARYSEYRAPFPSDQEFEQSLAARGLSPSELRAELRRSITIDKLFNREITSRVHVTEGELQQYYDENKAIFSLAEQQLHLAQILVTSAAESPVPNLLNDDATDEEAAKAKISGLEERLAAGEDFAELAQSYSEDPVSTPNGGDLGYIPQSQLESANLTLRRVVASLSPGDVSPVIETEGQYRIMRLISKEPGGQRDFSDPRVQQQIRDTLLNRKDQLLRAAFLEVIRSEATVQNHFAREVVDSYGAGD